MREDGTTVVQISVGNQTDLSEAKKYVSLPGNDHYLQVDTYQELSAVQINLLKIICTRVLKVYQEGIFDLVCNKSINFTRLSSSFNGVVKVSFFCRILIDTFFNTHLLKTLLKVSLI